MVKIFIWIVIILLFFLSFLGVIFPLIPSSIFLWIGFIIYHFLINGQKLTILFWIMMVAFTVVLFSADIIANSYFVKKMGGSKWGERSAAIAVLLGSFIIPPFGIIILPFIVVLIVELLQKRSFKNAISSSIGSLIGFLSGVFAKIVIQLIMIVWFVVTILI